MGAVGATSFIEYQTGMAIGGIGEGAAQGGGSGSPAETGMSLGAGMGMGVGMAGVMAQAMQQATAPKQAPAAPAEAAPAGGRSANRQTPAEVQALLDQLETRLANGEVSESTYNKLYAKWEQKLKDLGG